MGYLKIRNLYQDQSILLFNECYALEKIHGTSQHIGFKNGKIGFFSGGEKHERFVALFDEKELIANFEKQGITECIVYGEGYGGSQQRMKATYGDELKFIAFDVKINDKWLNVPDAEKIVLELGLEFVHYVKISTDLKEIDVQCDAPSVQAVRNGITEVKAREGIVLRPLMEATKNNGSRFIAKHKGETFSETKTPRTIDSNKMKVLKEATAIADEWCTHMRLMHILDKFPDDVGIENTGKVIKAMFEDIKSESEGETVITKDVLKAIGRATSILFKRYLHNKLTENQESE